MLKYFRAVKQKMLKENKLKSYLLYATGETLLVMVGILLALQVNTCNQNRIQNAEEQTALSNLKQDFETNLTSIKTTIANTDMVVEACVSLLKHTGNKYDASKNVNVDSLMLETINSYKYYPQNGFLDDLINSGKLDIIKNDQLRNLLSSWKPLIEFLRLREAISTDFNVKTIEYLVENGNFLRVDEKYSSGDLGLPKSGFTIDNISLLKEIVFENRVDNQIVYQDYKRLEQRKILAACKDILELINKELND